jgi:hypothetical protein
MNVPVKMYEVLKNEGVVAIVTQGDSSPHVVNTWNSYIRVTKEGNLLVPVGGMNVTEANIVENEMVLVTLGSREVEGFRSKGAGFLITATAGFLSDGNEFKSMKEEFPWCRAMLKIKPLTITQTL